MNRQESNQIKPRLCLLITRADIGGAQKHVESLAKNFAEEFEIEIIHGGGSYFEKSLKQLPIRLTQISAINSLNFPFAIYRLYCHLRNYPPDILHVHSTLASIYGRVCGSRLGFKIIYTVHGWFFVNPRYKHLSWLGSFIEKCLKKYSTKTVFVSKFDLRIAETVGCVDKAKTVYIPNSIPLTISPRPTNTKPMLPPLRIMFVGRLKWQKDPLLAIKAVQHCGQDVVLTIYGDGPLKKILKTHIDENNLGSKIKIVSNMQSLDSEYVHFDCLLVTSNYEGMPLSILEAMANGLPIISVDTCGLNELVESDYNGFLISNRSPIDIAKPLDSLAKSPQLIAKLGANSLVSFERNFNFNKFLQATGKLYQTTLDSQ